VSADPIQHCPADRVPSFTHNPLLNAAVIRPRLSDAARAIGRLGRPLRSILLLIVLSGELVHLGVPLTPYFNPTLCGWWWPIVQDGRLLGEAAIGGALVVIFLSWPIFRAELTAAIQQPDCGRLNFWLKVHLLCVALTAGWLLSGMQGGIFTATGATVWFLAGLALLPVTAITWSAAILPASFWMRWLSRSPAALAAGVITCVLTCSAGYFIQILWPPLRQYTFVTVGLMLHALGLPVVSDPSHSIIGTERFAVSVAPMCSGLEGVALISAFIAAYLWIYRNDYRFPAAIVLFPIGIGISWILNAVRITALILIGQWDARMAVTGFHTVAGWIFFNLTAFGVISASRQASWITRANHADLSRDRIRAPNPALPYLMPLLLTIAAAMLTASFAGAFDAAYPVRVILPALALWWYRDRIGTTVLGFSWVSFALGAVCCLLWIALTRPDHAADATFAAHLRILPNAMLSGWISFRMAGAIITVPIAEELAFRGYLMRKLIAPDFESVAFGRFTWPSFLISSAAFGALHQSWLAGMIAGGLFAIAIYHRGRLADAVMAHATANALLAIYVVASGSWYLWT
jgi:exosortase E/protease (VPEID-CTERM system)